MTQIASALNCGAVAAKLASLAICDASTLRSLARRCRSVLHETSSGSAQSYRQLAGGPVPVTLGASAAPKLRRRFAAQTAEHPRQVFLMGEAARQSDLRNR